MSRAWEQFFPELLLLSNSRLQYYSLWQALRQQGCRENKPGKKLDSRDLEKGALGARGFNQWYPGQEKGGGLWHTSHLPNPTPSASFTAVFTIPEYSWSPGGEVLTIMAYTGRLRPKEVPFSGFRYMKGQGFYQLKYIKGQGNLFSSFLKSP